MIRIVLCLVGCWFSLPIDVWASDRWEVAGVTVTPHVQSSVMRYYREPDRSLGARVQLFLRNVGDDAQQLSKTTAVRFRGQKPEELVDTDQWAWYDTPSAWPDSVLKLPAGAMTIWQFNSKRADWGAGTRFDLQIAASEQASSQKFDLAIENPRTWISSVTCIGDGAQVRPNRIVLHVANQSEHSLRLVECRLWLPDDRQSWRALRPRDWQPIDKSWPADGRIPAGDQGIAMIATGALPLTFAAIEIRCEQPGGETETLWAHLKIKRDVFDLSGGWVHSTIRGRSTLTDERFLKTLHRMHINTAHIADTPGYTDQDGPDGLYTRYPLKYFNKLQPLDHYDVDAMLPRVHAVEFLGEPQYGGGTPVPPMDVWRSLAPYQSSRLPTSVTHSEERIWRYYAGLSDFPHYDAYRVSAPSPDAWWKYDRWDGKKIRWGAPLETIGEMCRSLRETNRPLPTAYWSQGAHAGWGVYGRRQRTSPTPDELRMQAYHALASRITSLYWFNLSLKSVVKFPDLIEPITHIGREIRMLEEHYLHGDAYDYQQTKRDGRLDWDLTTISAPRAALLFALDLDYVPDAGERVFQFGSPRDVEFSFRLPVHMRDSGDGQAIEVRRLDADGLYRVTHRLRGERIEIEHKVSRVAIYVAAKDPAVFEQIEAKRLALIAQEAATGFDPGGTPTDREELASLLSDER